MAGRGEDQDPPSRDIHDIPVQSELAELKRGVTQQMAELSNAIQDIRKALGVKTEPGSFDMKVKKDEVSSTPPTAVEEVEEKMAPIKEELVAESMLEPKQEEELRDRHINFVYADPVGSPANGKPSPDMLKKLPEYNGDVPWEDYFSQFKIIRQAYGWSEEEAILERRFGKSFTPQVYISRLKARRRKKGESLSQLAQDIETLVFKAFPISRGFVPSLTHEILAKDYFIDALNDRELQLSVMLAHPSTIGDALACALELEFFLQAAGKEDTSWDKINSSPTSENKFSSWKPRTNGRNGSSRPVSPMKRARPARVPDRTRQPPAQKEFSGNCWQCGERGHRWGQCPTENVNTLAWRESGGQGRPERSLVPPREGRYPHPQTQQRAGNEDTLARGASAWPVGN